MCASASKTELGAPVEELYAAFDFTPLGSASIGQVHAATLLGGQEVVVKVQHEGIEQTVTHRPADHAAGGRPGHALRVGHPL